MKTCNGCKQEKELENFSNSSKSKDGKQWTCKVCDRERRKKYGYDDSYQNRKEYHRNIDKVRRENPERKSYIRAFNTLHKRKYYIKSEYNLTEEQLLDMYNKQEYKCAICGKQEDKMFHIDHCHTTSKVRGLLCQNCNIGLGFFKDNKDSLRKAIKYLENSE